MKRGFLAGLMAAAMLWGAEAALAQNETDPGGETTVVLEEIEVRSAVRRDELRSTSATVLGNDEIMSRVLQQPLDLLLMTPGVAITDFGAQGVANEAMIRGFKGGHGHDRGNIAFFLDGIPLQDSGHDDNYMDTNVIIPIEIESVEIIKGPQSVFYGPRAGAGAMAFQSYKAGDFTRMKMRYGSYNDIDTQGLIGRTHGNLSHVYAFQFRHTDGWADNSEWNLANVSGRWTYQFTDKFSASLNLRANSSKWDNPGYLVARLNLPDTAWVDDGSGQGAGGDRKRFDARLWANYELNDESQFTFYAFGTDLENTRWSKSFPTTVGWDLNDPSGSENTNHRKAFGLGTAYNFQGEIASREANISLGLEYLRENEVREQYGLGWGYGRARTRPQTGDQDYVLNTTSLFASASYQVLEPLQVRLGARYDRFTGHMDTGPNNGNSWGGPNQNLTAEARNVFSPRAGLLFTPLDWLDVFANYGQAYNVPGLNNGVFFSDPNAELIKHNQFELGTRARPANWLNLEVVYYYIQTLNDEIPLIGADGLPDPGGLMEFAGTTERQGLETSFSIRPFEFWSLSGHYTLQDAKFKKRKTNAGDYAGLRMTEVPRHITSLELAYAPDEGLGGRARFRWEADSLLRNDPAVRANGQPNPDPWRQFAAQDRGALDLQLSYKFNDEYKLTFDVLNVTDRRNIGSQWAPTYSPGAVRHGDYNYTVQPPRTFYVGLEANWK